MKRLLTLLSLCMTVIWPNMSHAQVLVPVEEYLKTTPHAYKAIDDGYIIYVPSMRRAGDYVYVDDNVHVEPIHLPTVKENGKTMVDLSESNGAVGVTYTEKKDKIKLKKAPERMALPKKVDVHTPVALVFDPMTTKPYSEKFTETGSNVISPSWFTLTEKGLQPSKEMTVAYVEQYKKAGYQVWPLVTNQFNPTFTHTVLMNEKQWPSYAQQLSQYAYIYGFSGYNLDFENINLEDQARLTKFVTYLGDTLNNFNIYSSMDVTGYSDSENWSLVYDRKALGKAVDYTVLMAYDETPAGSHVAGPVASYPWVKENLDTLLTEVPKEKVLLGIPWYTRQWTVTDGKAQGKTLAIKDSEALFSTHSNQIAWDNELKTHYLEYPVTTPDKAIIKVEKTGDVKKAPNVDTVTYQPTMREVWFEDNYSLQYKLNLMTSRGLAGFAAWRKGFESASTISFMQQYINGKRTNLEPQMAPSQLQVNVTRDLLVRIVKDDTEQPESTALID